MSEKNIIKEFENIIYNPDIKEIVLSDNDGFTSWNSLFENVLNAYNKIKEENRKLKELENITRETLKDSRIIHDNYIPKERIQNKINNLKQTNNNNNFSLTNVIMLLKGLLEG